MLGTLAFKAVRKQQDHAGREIPLIFTRADELVDDHLRAVDEVSELRFPQNESFGIVATETVFKTEAPGFRERRVVNFTEGRTGREIRKRNVSFFGLRVHKYGVALIECAALRVLAGKAVRRAFKQERTESERFGKTIVNGSFAVAHFRPLFEQFDDFRMDVKSVRKTQQGVRNLREFFNRNTGFHF